MFQVMYDLYDFYFVEDFLDYGMWFFLRKMEVVDVNIKRCVRLKMMLMK